MEDVDIWGLDAASTVIGPVGYHWTSEANARQIARKGLGTRRWIVDDHHHWYLFHLLDEAHQAPLVRKFGSPPFDRRPARWGEAVERAFAHQHPDAHVAWVAGDPEVSRGYGDTLVTVDLEGLAASDLEGDIFPDDVFGYAIVTYGRPIPRRFIGIGME